MATSKTKGLSAHERKELLEELSRGGRVNLATAPEDRCRRAVNPEREYAG